MSKLISQTRFINEAIEAHNRYRSKHGCAPLEVDEKLNEMAAEWAEHLALRDSLDHRNTDYKGEPLGENILRANKIYFAGKIYFSHFFFLSTLLQHLNVSTEPNRNVFFIIEIYSLNSLTELK